MELTNAQLERQDIVDSAVHNLMEELCGRTLEWNTEWRGEIVDVLCDIAEEHFKITELEFYPYIVEENEAPLFDLGETGQTIII